MRKKKEENRALFVIKLPYPMLSKREASLVVKKKVSTQTKLKKVYGCFTPSKQEPKELDDYKKKNGFFQIIKALQAKRAIRTTHKFNTFYPLVYVIYT